MMLKEKKWKTGFLRNFKCLSSFDFICLLDFISRLLFIYFMFELFDFSSWTCVCRVCACVCVCVVTGMLFTMQTKIQSCDMKG